MIPCPSPSKRGVAEAVRSRDCGCGCGCGRDLVYTVLNAELWNTLAGYTKDLAIRAWNLQTETLELSDQ